MRVRRRRTALAVVLALLVAAPLAACTSGRRHTQLPPTQTATGPTELPAAARQRGIAIGAEFVQVHYDSDYYRSQALDNFTSITPNRSFKWGYLEPQQGKFSFGESDKIMAFARENHLRVRGCCLAWGHHNPSWLTSGSWTKEQAKQLLHNYISTVVGRYKGQVAQWDVVNEGLTGPGKGPYTLAGTFWGRVIGPEYVSLAFQWAHEADPDAQLFYNDYGAEAPSAKFSAEFAMVKTLKAQGVPITGVGLQTHRPALQPAPPYYPTMPQVTNVLKAFKSIGIRTELTELDQPLPLPANRQSLGLQGMLYKQTVSACLAVDTCTGVTVWGIDDNDRYPQLRNNNLGVATLFGTMGQIKPSFLMVVQAMKSAPGPNAGERASPGAAA